MKKPGLIICMFVCVVSGCALFDGTDTVSENVSVVSPAPVDQNAAVAPVGVSPEKEAQEPAPRAWTRDDIRRLQLRLKEVGFDPGPADGVAGARTKAAFNRFQEGCSKVKGLTDNPEADAHGSNRIPVKQETQEIQSRLHFAGFDPGPIDGIFGSRTRSLLLQLKTHCLATNEFAGIFDRPAAKPEREAGSVQRAYGASRFQTVSAPNGSEGSKRVSPGVPAQSQQEIRILQLRLRDAGFDPGPFDGVMGPKTRLALQQYEISQRSKKTKISLTTNSVSGQY